MNALAELELLLRPAAGGLYVVSTGRAEQLEVQRRIYGAASTVRPEPVEGRVTQASTVRPEPVEGRAVPPVTENDIAARWREALGRVPTARALLVGIPSDVGAGLLRGANMGPQAIRARLVEEDPTFYDRAAVHGLIDVGDVFVVPQLLHDDMLSDAQLQASRAALYPALSAPERARLPVSPLSIAERAFELLLSLNPGAALLVLGGDHSCAWPAVKVLAGRRPDLAIVQIDAHTDLLHERLGIRYCFGTWSYHANELIGRGGRLIQVGVRASRHDRSHWERAHDVRQFWAAEVRADPARALDAIVEALRASGARSVYFTNDIDGTDETAAGATGTPEPDGLDPAFVVELIRRVRATLPLAGGDVMEVAPSLARGPGEPARTLSLAVRYLRETAAAALGTDR